MREDLHLIPIEQTKAAVKAEQDTPTPRYHLGASEIGKECRADLWHSFRWSVKGEFDADTHLRFLDGHRSEDVMAMYLRKAGVNLSTVGPDGRQHSFMTLGGHFAGSLDGIIRGGMPWHKKANESTIWEHKATNDKKFKELIKLTGKATLSALEAWDSVYFAQAQVYMLMKGIDSHWLTCSTAGCRDFTAVLTKLNRPYAEAMIEKAALIVGSQDTPIREYQNPEFFKAKFLKSYDVLYKGVMPEPNFRNSLFSYPVTDENRTDAAWYDDYLRREVTKHEQTMLPRHHLWNPAFITWAKCVGIEENTMQPRWAVYELENGFKFYNCQAGMEGVGAYNSEELRHLDPESIQDPSLIEMRKLGAAIVAA